jgi:hypothetical protein
MPLSPGTLSEASSRLAELVAALAGEFGSPPTLAELLELLGWAIPFGSEAVDALWPQPLTFKVTHTRSTPYRAHVASRVPNLDDHLFEDARDHHRVLVERMRATSGAPVTPLQFAAAILQMLRSTCITLADIKPDDIRTLLPDLPKKQPARPKPGDVLAIPAKDGGYHMAVVVALNRFGTALGLFQGTSAYGRLDLHLRRAPRKSPVYTDNGRIADGTWRIVGHDQSLLALFPSNPPIYHRPNAWPGIAYTGEFGAAETADGVLRLMGPDEAREAGLQDGTYRHPIHHAAWLQKLLDDEAGRP